MAGKRNNVKNKSTGSAGISKGTLIISVLISLAVGIYLGGVVVPAFKDSSSPQVGTGQGVTVSDQISELKKMTEAQPNSVELWTKLGNLYFDTDQPAKAIEAYQKSLAIKPDDPHVLIDLGVMYRRNGQADKAVEYFDRAIVVSPSHETAFFNKGIVQFYDLKDEAGAIRTWQQLVDLNPNAKTPNGGLVRDMIDELRPQKQREPLKTLSQ